VRLIDGVKIAGVLPQVRVDRGRRSGSADWPDRMKVKFKQVVVLRYVQLHREPPADSPTTRIMGKVGMGASLHG
jgi:hypothetical protein